MHTAASHLPHLPMLIGMSQETLTHWLVATFMSLTPPHLFLFVTWYPAGQGRDTDTARGAVVGQA
jgi:hypothetical protein